MTISDSNFNVPDFVAGAAPELLDAGAQNAAIVGGYRIDNPAAAWTAKADILSKKASKKYVETGVERRVNEACALFGIGDEHFSRIEKKASDILVVELGDNVAEFNVYDNASLNKAASDLISRRSDIPYMFAHDCAVALREASKALNLEFTEGNALAMRKMAGDCHVDFAAGKAYINNVADVAEAFNMSKCASELRRVAAVCSDDCDESIAKVFIAAVDDFNHSAGLIKSASIDKHPEDVFYLSNTEFIKKQASEVTQLADGTIIPAHIDRKNADCGITKWASIAGYSISADADTREIVDVVSSMPKALRDEFVKSFC